MNDDPTKSKRSSDQSDKGDNTRIDALFVGAVFVGFVWLCFDGLLNDIGELLRPFLPHFFATFTA